MDKLTATLITSTLNQVTPNSLGSQPEVATGESRVFNEVNNTSVSMESSLFNREVEKLENDIFQKFIQDIRKKLENITDRKQAQIEFDKIKMEILQDSRFNQLAIVKRSIKNLKLSDVWLPEKEHQTECNWYSLPEELKLMILRECFHDVKFSAIKVFNGMVRVCKEFNRLSKFLINCNKNLCDILNTEACFLSETKNENNDLKNSLSNIRLFLGEYVLLNGIEAKDKQGDTFLHCVVDTLKGEGVELVGFILNYLKVDLNAKNKEGNTVLNIAAIYGYYEIVQALLAYGKDKGIDINIAGSHGDTPLLQACVYARKDTDPVRFSESHLKIVRLLCEQKEINVNAKTFDLDTPLHIMCRYGLVEEVRILLNHDNIDSELKLMQEFDEEKITPYGILIRRVMNAGYGEILQLFSKLN